MNPDVCQSTRASHRRFSRSIWALTTAACAAGCGPIPCEEDPVADARAAFGAQLTTAPAPSDHGDAGLAALTDWSALPCMGTRRYTQHSSQRIPPGRGLLDYGGGDFNNFVAVGADAPRLLIQSSAGSRDGSGFVLAAQEGGPGYVSRLFLTRFSLFDLPGLQGLGQFDAETLHVYIDDPRLPALTIPVRDIGSTVPFVAPFATRDNAATVCYVPLSFREQVRVELDSLCPFAFYFYHVDIQRSAAPTTPFTARIAESPAYAGARELLRGTADVWHGDEIAIDGQRFALPAKTAIPVYTATGPGTINRLTFRWAADADLQDVHLLVRYEGASAWGVDCPLAALLGVHYGNSAFATLPLRVRRLESDWVADFLLPLPFASSLQLALENRGAAQASVVITLARTSSVPALPWGYLHAHYHALASTPPAVTDHEVARIRGRGRYVGTWLYATGRADRRLGPLQHPLNLLEGNETGVIDGAPAILGTGTEDYFNAGFYFRRGPFSQPFAAAPVVDATERHAGRVACVRWHVLSDAIDFRDSFELRLQYGDRRPDLVVDFATVALFYLDRPAP